MAQTPTCPICKRPLSEREDALRFRPFCSKRCADVDLGRWLKGAYAIPAAEAEDDDGETADGQSGDGDSTDGDGAPRARH